MVIGHPEVNEFFLHSQKSRKLNYEGYPEVIGLLLCMTICCYMTGKEKKNLNIVFIGNSITQGALLENPRHEAPPVKAALYLRRQPSVGTVRYSNQGVSGSTTF